MSITDTQHDDDGEEREPASRETDGGEIAPMEPAGEASVSFVAPGELEAMRSKVFRSAALPASEKALATLDSLIPLAASAAQAAQTYDMAVVRFPPGVSWADLCVRKEDGWNLLSHFEPDGKFGDMAAIKRAGITPAGAANLALQIGAAAVGMQYMNVISSQLDTLQRGVGEIIREMELERQAELKTAFDDLDMLASRQEEYLATPEKRQLALQIADRARHDATGAWNYQLAAIRDYAARLLSKKGLDERGVREGIDRLVPMEARAASAYELVAAAEGLAMVVDADYSKERIESERGLSKKLSDEYESIVGPVESALLDRIKRFGGPPLLPAKPAEDGYEAQNPVLDAVHEGIRQANRLNPLRMARTASEDVYRRKRDAQGKLLAANRLSSAANAYEKKLADVDFAFNEADALVLENGQLRAISTHQAEHAGKATGDENRDSE